MEVPEIEPATSRLVDTLIIQPVGRFYKRLILKKLKFMIFILLHYCMCVHFFFFLNSHLYYLYRCQGTSIIPRTIYKNMDTISGPPLTSSRQNIRAFFKDNWAEHEQKTLKYPMCKYCAIILQYKIKSHIRAGIEPGTS